MKKNADIIERSKGDRIPAEDLIKPAFRCRRDEWEEFKRICDKKGIVPSKLFRAFLQDFIKDNREE